MSKRSYTACYVHLVWGTKDREKLLPKSESRKRVNQYIFQYAAGKKIPIKTGFTNADHIHLLIALPTDQTLEDIVKLIKGGTSHWINQNDVIQPKFAWSAGYAAFTMSKLNVDRVYEYIQNQEEHHRRVAFQEEYGRFIREYCEVQTDESV